MAQGGSLPSALGNIPQYFRQKYIPLRHTQSRIYIGTTEREISTHILSESQAAMKALDNHQINRSCNLAKHNRVLLIWVPGHEGIVGKETADQLAKLGFECPFIVSEPACGISLGVAKKFVTD
jgi:DNA-binding MurR/RpiR family transcriptional regulator